jgi:hypothetical protein
MTIVNLTPHAVIVRQPDGSDLSLPPDGTIARVAATEVLTGAVIAGVDVARRTFGDVTGLPDPTPGVVFVVSSLVLTAVSGRPDVVAPDTGPTAIRSPDGRILAVTRFVTA